MSVQMLVYFLIRWLAGKIIDQLNDFLSDFRSVLIVSAVFEN